jgi:hypothetical protein
MQSVSRWLQKGPPWAARAAGLNGSPSPLSPIRFAFQGLLPPTLPDWPGRPWHRLAASPVIGALQLVDTLLNALWLS